MSQKVIEAMVLAESAHRGQLYGEHDYYHHHVLGVEKLCSELFGPHVPTQIAAILHDIVEDTDVTIDEIEKLFGDEISDAVYSITKQGGESRKTYLGRCKNHPIARDVKIADTLFNLIESVTIGDAKRVSKYSKQLSELHR